MLIPILLPVRQCTQITWYSISCHVDNLLGHGVIIFVESQK